MADREGSSQVNQFKPLTCPTTPTGAFDFVEEFQPASNRISDAARWYSEFERKGLEPVIPILRKEFGLSITQATEAAKLGHKMKYQGAAHV